MKLTKMMIAVAALAGSSSLFAAPAADRITNISGASAFKGNVANALNGLCVGAGGLMREWIAGGNVSTFVCFAPGSEGFTSGAAGTYASAPAAAFIDFNGTTTAEVRLNVAGGAFTSLVTLAGGLDSYVNPGLGGTVVAGGLVNFGVTGGQLVLSQPGIGGYSDINVDGYAENVKAAVPGLDAAIAANTAANVGVAQGFGVAASDALYGVMFTAQQTAGTIPGTCLVTNTNVAQCVPSISKAQMASIMSSSASSAGKTQGVRFLAPQVAAGLELRYARRVDTSGTQSSAQNYFLGIGNMTGARNVIADPSDRVSGVAANTPNAVSGCNIGDVRGPGFANQEVDTAFVALGQIDLCDRKTSNLRVVSTPGTSDVRNELNKATIQGGAVNYALGVMSLENDQATYRNTANVVTPTTWKWLRVQGVMPGENATPGANTNRTTLVSGDYDFYYQLWSYHQTSPSNDALIAAINSGLTTGGALKGLTVIGSGVGQQPWQRNGRTDTPSAR